MQRKTKTNFPILFILLSTIVVFSLMSCVQVNQVSGNYPPLIKAAQQGNITEIDELYRSGENIGQTTIGNQTALHLAAIEGQNEMVKWLLAREANPLAQDQNGKTPADFANQQGHSETAKIIDDYVALVQKQEEAFFTGDFEKLEELLVDDYRQYTLLHIFSQNGLADQIKAEIEAGADVNAKTGNGLTPLHKSILIETTEIASLLLENGADVNSVDPWNNPPIYYAISLNKPEMVKVLLENGADVEIRSVFGNESMTETAIRIGNSEIIQLMEN